MALAEATYTGDGTTTEFNIPFDYLQEDHVKITLNTVSFTGFTVDTSTTPKKVVFSAISTATATQETSGAPKTGVDIVVYRDTPLNAPLVDYTDGSTLIADDLDTSNKQWLYALQEVSDVQSAGLNATPQGLDANSKRIINLSDPINDQDAVTKNYLDDQGFFKADGTVALTGNLAVGSNKITGLANGTNANDAVNKSQLDAGIQNASTAQEEAEASAAAAATSEDNAADSATAAANSAAAAAQSATDSAAFARESVFVGFRVDDTDSELEMHYSETNDNETYLISDYQAKGGIQWFFLGEDVLAQAGNNENIPVGVPSFHINDAGHLLLEMD